MRIARHLNRVELQATAAERRQIKEDEEMARRMAQGEEMEVTEVVTVTAPTPKPSEKPGICSTFSFSCI